MRKLWSKVKSYFNGSTSSCEDTFYIDHQFQKWAYGDQYQFMSHIEKVAAWNSLHSKLFIITDPYEERSKLYHRMKPYWQQEQISRSLYK